MSVVDRFINYVQMDTTSDPDSNTVPSTREAQIAFADLLVEELKAVGAADAARDDNGYVMATVPATTNEAVPVVGFVAHMDTACDAPGKNIHPRKVSYQGGDIVLNEEKNIVLSPEAFPAMNRYIGQTLIVTDGLTLLGGDDKAGVAEIVSMAEYLLSHPEIKHGKIRICFTPDEEIGSGADHFDVNAFGADYAYTLDGGELGELEYENFNAGESVVEVTGLSIHPGSAKGKMISAIRVGMEFQELLPTFEKPEYTEGYEGFYHLIGFNGTVEHTKMTYILRDHDSVLYEKKKNFMQTAAAFLNEKYGLGTVKVTTTDSYRNMKEKIEPFPFLLDNVMAVYDEMGIEPRVQAIRGGTDGARLSFMGLPCPNLGTGDFNCHGHFEFVVAESMQTAVTMLVKLAEKFAQ